MPVRLTAFPFGRPLFDEGLRPFVIVLGFCDLTELGVTGFPQCLVLVHEGTGGDPPTGLHGEGGVGNHAFGE